MLDWNHLKTKKQLEAEYRELIPRIRAVAKRCGYGIAIHGSMRRDLDIMAMPWEKWARTPEWLVMQISKELLGYTAGRGELRKDGRRCNKPHGRLAYNIILASLWNKKWENKPWPNAFLDISVMPRCAQQKRARRLR